jgi:CubicO group peptidase (beta-lactamase class C family)
MSRQLSRSLAGALALFVPSVVLAQALPRAATVARVADSLAKAFLADGSSPSVAIGLVRGRDTVVMRAWGKADLENDVDATAASVYRIGSVTKQFTAAAVMQLVEQGKVKLDDSIGTYLPTLPAAWRPAKVRYFLNHTSGVPSYTEIGLSWVRRWGEIMSPDTIVALTARDTMWYAPGTAWHYNNTGYVVLGMLIEKITGKKWGDDLVERFAKPLGLAHTLNCLAVPLIPHRARGYDKTAAGWDNTSYLEMSQPHAAGAMCSTIGDLARWNRAIHTGKVVSAASYALMTTPEGAAAAGKTKYGFAFFPDTIGGRAVIQHGGGINGFITANAWVPSAELSVTVFTNSSGGKSGALSQQLMRAALGLPLNKPAAPDKKP